MTRVATRLVWGLSILVMLAALAVPGDAFAAGPDGPGSFYVFRTRDTTQAPTATQNQACADYFGPVRSASVVTKLNAALFAFNEDRATGRVTDQTAAALGPGFICAAPGAGTGGELDAFAYTALPSTGTVDATGPCAVEPVLAQAGSAIVNCHLQPQPDQLTGVSGGLITSNSVLNESGSAGAPTGSIWTAYVAGTPRVQTAHPLPVGPVSGEASGIDFYVARALEDGNPSGCPSGGVGGSSDALSSVQPGPATGQIQSALGPRIGHLQVCYVSAIAGGFVAQATATVTAAGGSFAIQATGQCDNNTTTVGNDQSCALTITSSTAAQVKGGLLTSNGLADAADPSRSPSTSVWTMALFGAPDDTPGRAQSGASRPLHVRLRAPRRARSGRVLIRWSAQGAISYEVQTGYYRRAGVHWNRRLALRRTHLRVRFHAGLAAVRVRAYGTRNQPGAWSTARIRVRKRNGR